MEHIITLPQYIPQFLAETPLILLGIAGNIMHPAPLLCDLLFKVQFGTACRKVELKPVMVYIFSEFQCRSGHAAIGISDWKMQHFYFLLFHTFSPHKLLNQINRPAAVVSAFNTTQFFHKIHYPAARLPVFKHT